MQMREAKTPRKEIKSIYVLAAVVPGDLGLQEYYGSSMF